MKHWASSMRRIRERKLCNHDHYTHSYSDYSAVNSNFREFLETYFFSVQKSYGCTIKNVNFVILVRNSQFQGKKKKIKPAVWIYQAAEVKSSCLHQAWPGSLSLKAHGSCQLLGLSVLWSNPFVLYHLPDLRGFLREGFLSYSGSYSVPVAMAHK